MKLIPNPLREKTNSLRPLPFQTQWPVKRSSFPGVCRLGPSPRAKSPTRGRDPRDAHLLRLVRPNKPSGHSRGSLTRFLRPLGSRVVVTKKVGCAASHDSRLACRRSMNTLLTLLYSTMLTRRLGSARVYLSETPARSMNKFADGDINLDARCGCIFHYRRCLFRFRICIPLAASLAGLA